MDLSNYFSRVLCLSLKRRQDRRDALLAHLKDFDWPFKRPEFFDAIDGNEIEVDLPALKKQGWETTKGWYASVISHMSLAKYIIETSSPQDNPVLILEDDAMFNDDFATKIEEFLINVPQDWDALMIGGFNVRLEKIARNVGRCYFLFGNHCFSIRGKMLKDYYTDKPMMNTDWIVSSLLTRKYKGYCPIPFLSGQRTDFSDGTYKVENYVARFNGEYDFKPKRLNVPTLKQPEVKPVNIITGGSSSNPEILAGVAPYAPATIRWLHSLRKNYKGAIALVLTDRPEVVPALTNAFKVDIIIGNNPDPQESYLKALEQKYPNTNILVTDVANTVFQRDPTENPVTHCVLAKEATNYTVKDGAVFDSDGRLFTTLHDEESSIQQADILNRLHPLEKYKVIAHRMARQDDIWRPVIGVEISTKDRWVDLLVCLQSLLTSTLIPDVLGIWVDGNPIPKELEQNYQYVLRSLLNLGCITNFFQGAQRGSSRNHETARLAMPCDLLFRIDDDEAVFPSVIETLLTAFQDPSVGAAGGLVINPMIPKPLPPLPETAIKVIGALEYKPHPQQFLQGGTPYEVEHLHSTYMYRRNIDVAYCDKLSPKCFREETLHTYQIKRKGYKILIMPEAITEHRERNAGGYRDKAIYAQAVANCKHDDEILRRLLQMDGVLKSDSTTPSTSFADIESGSFFSEAICISLKRREDRRELFLETVKNSGWPFVQPTFFDAFDAKEMGIIPQGWIHPGSFGCSLSHQKVLRYAIEIQNRNQKPVLILEDDVVFPPDFGGKVKEFLKNVPEDWEGLMIGGDHEGNVPTPIREGVGKCIYTVFLHCYCLRGRLLVDFYNIIANPNNRLSIDRVLASMMKKYQVYCPIPFLAGQRASLSDIDDKLRTSDRW